MRCVTRELSRSFYQMPPFLKLHEVQMEFGTSEELSLNRLYGLRQSKALRRPPYHSQKSTLIIVSLLHIGVNRHEAMDY
jgi:hypothetical protein